MKISLVEQVQEGFKNLDISKSPLKPFEDIGNKIIISNGKKMFEGSCLNRNFISESSLSRALDLMSTKEFAIITAQRNYDSKGKKLSKDDNINRNKVLKSKLDSLKMGVHQLIGHWRECSNPDVDYKDCNPKDLIDIIERSYLVPKPDNMESEKFKKTLIDLMTINGETQDAFILKNDKGVYLVYKNGSTDNIGTSVSLGKIQQAYSQHVKKLNVPFVFEGLEIPNSTMTARSMRENNILYNEF